MREFPLHSPDGFGVARILRGIFPREILDLIQRFVEQPKRISDLRRKYRHKYQYWIFDGGPNDKEDYDYMEHLKGVPLAHAINPRTVRETWKDDFGDFGGNFYRLDSDMKGFVMQEIKRQLVIGRMRQLFRRVWQYIKDIAVENFAFRVLIED